MNKEYSYKLVKEIDTFVTAEKFFYPLCARNIRTAAKHLHSTFFV